MQGENLMNSKLLVWFLFFHSLEHNPKVFDKKYYYQEVLTIIIYACKYSACYFS